MLDKSKQEHILLPQKWSKYVSGISRSMSHMLCNCILPEIENKSRLEWDSTWYEELNLSNG